MKRRSGARWTIPRSDLLAGGAELVRLHHALLPAFTSAWLRSEGLVLGPDVPEPEPLPAALDEAGRRVFLVRLLGLLAFLRAHGLGVLAADVAGIGLHKGKPALGAAPVPEWRAVSPALAVAAVAVRLSGAPLAGDGPRALLGAVERALESGVDAASSALIIAALKADATRRAPEALLFEWATPLDGVPALGGDLLGLAYPATFASGDETAAGVAEGEAALYVARGAVRRRAGERSFVEVTPASAMEEGATLARLANAFPDDPRRDALRSLAAGRRAEWRDGPPVAILVEGGDEWDSRTRHVWDAELPACASLFRVETRARPLPPWEPRTRLVPRLSSGEVSALLWMPFRSALEAAETWEKVAGEAAGDAARFLATARELADGFGPAGVSERRRRAPRAEPALQAASILADDFTAGEAAAAAGVPLERAETALAAAVAGRRLAESSTGRFRFVREDERQRFSERLSAAARRDAVTRLAAAGYDGTRFTVAALSRGDEADVAAAVALFREAARAEDAPLVLQLLRRAGDAGASFDPFVSLLVLADAGDQDAARLAARRLDRDAVRREPLLLRRRAARRLASLGEPDLGLSLLDEAASSEELLAKARQLVDLWRGGEAATLLGSLDETMLTPPERVQALLIRADVATRKLDLAAAERALHEVPRYLDDSAASLDAAFLAGHLAMELGRSGDAAAFYRRARELSVRDLSRANAAADLAGALMQDGRLAEAEKELASALSLYERMGDETRFTSTLGNRAELHLRAGSYDAARADLERVLFVDRKKGHEHALPFGLQILQKLSLLSHDLEAAYQAFREADEVTFRTDPEHASRREMLALEAVRLLTVREPREAARALAAAGAVPDNRSQSDTLVSRLRASVAVDVGESVPVGLPPLEQTLVLAEERLRRGGSAGPDALLVLERRLTDAAGEVTARLLEWSGRFPEAFSRELAALGQRAASRAGLQAAAARFRDLAEVPPEAPAVRAAQPLPAEVVSEDESTRAVFVLVSRVAPTAISVLILGESGTGKEIVAKTLHARSLRRGDLVPVNVAAISETLMESELFGHARGAFTGAERDRAGLVEQSSGGTLFLDEIGDLPLPLQAKLLRVLQEQEVRRVGETNVRKVDLRVVAATHRDLPALVSRQAFRADLYHRLNGITVALTPLRERPRDLAALLDRSGLTFASEVRSLLAGHPWPGNLREVRAMLESARALAAPSTRILEEHLPASLRRSRPAGEITTYKKALAEARRRIIREALQASDGNRTLAAKRLGLARQSLLYEMRKLSIE